MIRANSFDDVTRVSEAGYVPKGGTNILLLLLLQASLAVLSCLGASKATSARAPLPFLSPLTSSPVNRHPGAACQWEMWQVKIQRLPCNWRSWEEKQAQWGEGVAGECDYRG